MMDHHDLPQDGLLSFDNFDQLYPYMLSSWPILDTVTINSSSTHNAPSPPLQRQQQRQQQHQQHQQQHQQQQQQQLPSHRRLTIPTSASVPPAAPAPLQSTAELGGFTQQSINPSATLLTSPDWQFNLQQPHYVSNVSLDPTSFGSAFAVPLQPLLVDFSHPTTQAALNSSLALDSSLMAFSSPLDQAGAMSFQMGDFQNEPVDYPIETGFVSNDLVPSAGLAGASPTENYLEVRSLSSSDIDGWSLVDFPQHRHSFESYADGSSGTVFNPIQTLHIRTNSNSSQHSDVPSSAHSFGSYEDISFPSQSPESSDLHFDLPQSQHLRRLSHPPIEHDRQLNSFVHSSVSPDVLESMSTKVATSTTPSTSSSLHSSPSKRRKSPVGSKVAKTKAKKSNSQSKKCNASQKGSGRRRGPLRPDQRQQAHEIRRRRACLRCKFLKKTCDTGDPCAGCQPSHARLWQVPCTRIDIKDISYFQEGWKADFERHISLGNSVSNIKEFSSPERTLFISHGYGFYIPISAREIRVHDDNCFGIDWLECVDKKTRTKQFELTTAKLSSGMNGISCAIVSEYLDRHIDDGFERFVDEYFQGTYFITEIMKTAYKLYKREKLPVIRKALKFVLAYNLTLHVTVVKGLSEEESKTGIINDSDSRFYGETIAPVMINFQLKHVLATIWRALQKELLQDLSSLYSSVYSGDKLKNWPTIFIVVAIILAIWEEMQFDCHYRMPDKTAVERFCSEMESTPIGVIIGLFSAISQKLPSFSEWDTSQHRHLLNSNDAVCDAMTEVRSHVRKYESYLKTRPNAEFSRDDIDSMSNKFLSKLVIRAN